jgi:hypothetical protein
MLARGAAGWIDWPSTRRPAVAAGASVAALLLWSFHSNYFREFAVTGGRSHLTYVTAAVEPKQQALEQIVARTPGSEPVAIVAQQWWLVWPIRYLAKAHQHVSVTADLDSLAATPQFPDLLRQGRLFFVEFSATRELADQTEWVRVHGFESVTSHVQDASGRDLLTIVQVSVK